MSIEIRNLSCTFGSLKALDDVSLQVNTGELTALLGPSGCGKTTLLRIIAGLESADAGCILIAGQDMTGVPVQQRQVGFVFQNYALFRHMSVFDNIAFGLRARPRARRPSAAAVRERVMHLLDLVQLQGLADRFPSQLSGGQRQRVALARALAIEPRILLLDEPFGALDAHVRKELRRWLRKLHGELDITTIFVTHDQAEALEVADRVVIMNRGHVEQAGTPYDVWEHPATPFVCGFLGDANRLDGHTENGRWQGHRMTLPAPGLGTPGKQPALAFVRPHEFDVLPAADDSAPGLSARLTHVYLAGSEAHLEVERLEDSAPMEVKLPMEVFEQLGLQRGQTIRLLPRRARVFAAA